jgi:hypothetical protein
MLLSGGASNLFARTATTDLNGDGRPDIVVGVTGKGKSANSTPVVLLATGLNTYAAPAPVAVPAGAGESVSIADVNGDGIKDLLVSGSRKAGRGTANSRSPLVLQGLGSGGVGNGTFGPAASLNVPRVNGATYAFGVGDFNADGLTDVVVEGGKAPKQTAATPGGRQLLLLMNAAGTLGAPQAVPVDMRQIVGMTAGRFGSTTGDDLVLAGRGGGGGGKGQGLTIVRNLGSVSAATSIPIPQTFNVITDAAAGDFNKDTRLDLVVASRGGANRNGGLTLLTGNADGTFAAGQPIASAPAGTATVDVADFEANPDPATATADLLTGPAKGKGRNTFISALQAVLNTGTAFQAAVPITVATA